MHMNHKPRGFNQPKSDCHTYGNGSKPSPWLTHTTAEAIARRSETSKLVPGKCAPDRWPGALPMITATLWARDLVAWSLPQHLSKFPENFTRQQLICDRQVRLNGSKPCYPMSIHKMKRIVSTIYYVPMLVIQNIDPYPYYPLVN